MVPIFGIGWDDAPDDIKLAWEAKWVMEELTGEKQTITVGREVGGGWISPLCPKCSSPITYVDQIPLCPDCGWLIPDDWEHLVFSETPNTVEE